MANGQQQQQQANPYSGLGTIGQEWTKGMLRATFSSLGDAFATEFQNPELRQAFGETGENITNAMQVRWWKKEAEDFDTLYTEPYKIKTNTLNSQLEESLSGINSGILPNGMQIQPGSEESLRLEGDVLNKHITSLAGYDDELIQAAEKYKTNPFINIKIQNLMQSRTAMIQQLTGPGPGLEREGQIADIDLTRAQAEQARAGAASHRANARATSAKEPDFTKMGLAEWIQNFGFTGAHQILTSTPHGFKVLEPYIASQTGKMRQHIAKGKKLNLANPFHKDQVDAEIAQRQDEVRNAAVREAVGQVAGPQAVRMMEDIIPQVKQASPIAQKTPPKYPEAMPEKEQRKVIKKDREMYLSTLDDVIKLEDPPTLSMALERVQEIVEADAAYNIAGNSTMQNKFRKNYADQVIRWIRKNWKQSELAGDRYGRQAQGEQQRQRRGLLEEEASPPGRGRGLLQYLSETTPGERFQATLDLLSEKEVR